MALTLSSQDSTIFYAEVTASVPRTAEWYSTTSPRSEMTPVAPQYFSVHVEPVWGNEPPWSVLQPSNLRTSLRMTVKFACKLERALIYLGAVSPTNPRPLRRLDHRDKHQGRLTRQEVSQHLRIPSGRRTHVRFWSPRCTGKQWYHPAETACAAYSLSAPRAH